MHQMDEWYIVTQECEATGSLRKSYYRNLFIQSHNYDSKFNQRKEANWTRNWITKEHLFQCQIYSIAKEFLLQEFAILNSDCLLIAQFAF